MPESDNNGNHSGAYQEHKGGKFVAGNPGKPKGAVTKVSIKVRESIVNFLEANVDKIQADFDKLKPRERLQFVSDILPYAAPKLSSIQTEIQGDISHRIEITWNEPNEPGIEVLGTNDKGSDGELQGL